jgi:hypothetical protein
MLVKAGSGDEVRLGAIGWSRFGSGVATGVGSAVAVPPGSGVEVTNPPLSTVDKPSDTG